LDSEGAVCQYVIKGISLLYGNYHGQKIGIFGELVEVEVVEKEDNEEEIVVDY